MIPVALFLITFTGRNGAGAISVPGLKVGDRGLFLWEHPVSSPSLYGSTLWEPVVSVNDELQQISSTDFSSTTWDAFILRSC